MLPAKRNRPKSPHRFPQIPAQLQNVMRTEAEKHYARSRFDSDCDDETLKGSYPTPRLLVDPLKPLRVLIVDDQLLVRAGICELVKALPNVDLIGEARDGREALQLIKKHDPDIVLMDLAMPVMNGLEALVLAHKQFPRVKIIILAEHANEELVSRALRAGAAGFVVKDDPVDELYTAIKSVSEGVQHLSPRLTMKAVFGHIAVENVVEQPPKRLTPRQREVLKQIAEGKSTKEIATRLLISVNTVKTHRLKLMEKLGVHEISGVVRYAAKLGLIKDQ